MAHSLRDKKVVQPVVSRQSAKPSPTSKTQSDAQSLSAAPESAQQILHLQRSMGNRAVQRLMGRNQQPASTMGAAGGPIAAPVQQGIDQARGHGQAVDPQVSSQVGQALSADFSGVQVHTDTQSDTLNRSLSSEAFTTGSDIFFSQGAYNPGAQSGRSLLTHELTHVAQQGAGKSNSVQTKLKVGPASDAYEQQAEQTSRDLASGQVSAPSARAASPSIQRLFGKKKKPKLDKANEAFEDTGTAPNEAIFVLKAAVKTGTKTRGAMSWSDLLGGGSGHSWLSLSLGPAYADVDALRDNATDGDQIAGALDTKTQAELDGSRESSIGFYPDAKRPTRKKQMAKQIFANLPGKIIEPEQAHFKGQERGSKGYAITDSTQALTLINFINIHRSHPYNVFSYNCTDFVIKALKQLGFSLGETSNGAGITTPALMYKQIYKKSERGDKTSKTTALSNKVGHGGKTYDAKHVSKKTQKKLNKEKAKGAPLEAARAKAALESRVIAEYSIDDFVGIKTGGMMRPNTPIQVTGTIDGDWGEILWGSGVNWVNLLEFERKAGHPYPGAASKLEAETQDEQDAPLPNDQLLDVMDNVEQVEPDKQADAPEQHEVQVPVQNDAPEREDEGPQIPPRGTVLALKADVNVMDRDQPPNARVVPAGTTIYVEGPVDGGRLMFDSSQKLYGRVTATVADFLAAI
jgi:Domain of unknown function (DUF4157)